MTLHSSIPIETAAPGRETEDFEALEQEVRILESKLAAAKAKLKASSSLSSLSAECTQYSRSEFGVATTTSKDASSVIKSRLSPFNSDDFHLWLLLADSALPIGSFAFSSGLESYTVHRNLQLKEAKQQQKYNYYNNNTATNQKAGLDRFTALSLRSVSSAVVPYVKAAFLEPERACELDDQFDASTTCSVARRASVSQGKALLAIWEKSFGSAISSGSEPTRSPTLARNAVNNYKTAVRKEDGEAYGHFGVAWGVVCRAAGIGSVVFRKEEEEVVDDGTVDHVLFVFLFNHVRAVLSAAVRQGIIGPYGAQTMLASSKLKRMLWRGVEAGKEVTVEDACQTVPTMDLYQGRHEILYSRVFNS